MPKVRVLAAAVVARQGSSRFEKPESGTSMRIRRKSALLVMSMVALFGASGAIGWSASAHHTSWTNMYSDQYWWLADCSSGGGTPDPGDQVCMQDNAAVYFYIQGSISSTGRYRIASWLYDRDSSLDLSFTFDDPPTYTGGAETDIIYQQGTLPAGVLGQTLCNAIVNTLRCDQTYVRYSAATPGYDVICHESAHAFGLKHGDKGANAQGELDIRDNDADFLRCLRTPATGDTLLGDHNVQEVNHFY